MPLGARKSRTGVASEPRGARKSRTDVVSEPLGVRKSCAEPPGARTCVRRGCSKGLSLLTLSSASLDSALLAPCMDMHGFTLTLIHTSVYIKICARGLGLLGFFGRACHAKTPYISMFRAWRCSGAAWRSKMPRRRRFGAAWRSKKRHRRRFGAAWRSKKPHRHRLGAAWRAKKLRGAAWRSKMRSKRLFEGAASVDT